MEALSFLQGNDEKDEIDLPQGDTLSDFDVKEEGLLPLNLFDDDDDDVEENVTAATEQSTPRGWEETSLDQALGNLSLAAAIDPAAIETLEAEAMSALQQDDPQPNQQAAQEEFPPIYCQPCGELPVVSYYLPFELPDIDFEEPLPWEEENLQQQDDFEDQIAAMSMLRRSDSNNNEQTGAPPQDFAQGSSSVKQDYDCRPEALAAAQPFLSAINSKKERTCFGHKETIFGLAFSECGSYLATASQDANICVWKTKTNALLSKLTGHSRDFECLRTTWASSTWAKRQLKRSPDNYSFLLASGDANGIVKLWTSQDPSKKDSFTCVCTINHASFEIRKKKQQKSEEEKEDDAPQIYALQFIDHWHAFSSEEENSFLLTTSDDYVHLWEIEPPKIVDENEPRIVEITDNDDDNELVLKEVMSIRFHEMDHFGGGCTVGRVTSSGLAAPFAPQPGKSATASGGFGGDRNPEELVYVFDASYCQANGLLGVALSDGTLRLLNGRGICVSILQLPGCQSHLTSFAWDSTGLRLATCVATSHLILWDVDLGDSGNGRVVASCSAVLEGGHYPGRPLFGARYCGGVQEDLIVSWGVDGRLCLWDSRSHGQVHAPISTLIDRDSYPIYAVDISRESDKKEEDPGSKKAIAHVAVGGGRDGGFLGVPVYLYDVFPQKTEAAAE